MVVQTATYSPEFYDTLERSKAIVDQVLDARTGVQQVAARVEQEL